MILEQPLDMMCRGSPQDQPRDDPTDATSPTSKPTNKPTNKPNRMKNERKQNRKLNDNPKKESIEQTDIRKLEQTEIRKIEQTEIRNSNKRKSKETEKDGFEDGPIKTKKVSTKRNKPTSKELKPSTGLTTPTKPSLNGKQSTQVVKHVNIFRSDSPGLDLSVFQPRGKRKCVIENEGKKSTKKRGWWTDDEEEEEVEDIDTGLNGFHEGNGGEEVKKEEEDDEEQEEEIKEEDIIDEELPSERKKRRGPQRKKAGRHREKRSKSATKESSKASSLPSPTIMDDAGEIAAEVTVAPAGAAPVTAKSYVFSTAMANRAGYHVHKGTYPTVIAYHEAQEWAMPYLTSEIHCRPFNEELEMQQVKKEEDAPSPKLSSIKLPSSRPSSAVSLQQSDDSDTKPIISPEEPSAATTIKTEPQLPEKVEEKPMKLEKTEKPPKPEKPAKPEKAEKAERKKHSPKTEKAPKNPDSTKASDAPTNGEKPVKPAKIPKVKGERKPRKSSDSKKSESRKNSIDSAAATASSVSAAQVNTNISSMTTSLLPVMSSGLSALNSGATENRELLAGEMEQYRAMEAAKQMSKLAYSISPPAFNDGGSSSDINSIFNPQQPSGANIVDPSRQLETAAAAPPNNAEAGKYFPGLEASAAGKASIDQQMKQHQQLLQQKRESKQPLPLVKPSPATLNGEPTTNPHRINDIQPPVDSRTNSNNVDTGRGAPPQLVPTFKSISIPQRSYPANITNLNSNGSEAMQRTEPPSISMAGAPPSAVVSSSSMGASIIPTSAHHVAAAEVILPRKELKHARSEPDIIHPRSAPDVIYPRTSEHSRQQMMGGPSRGGPSHLEAAGAPQSGPEAEARARHLARSIEEQQVARSMEEMQRGHLPPQTVVGHLPTSRSASDLSKLHEKMDLQRPLVRHQSPHDKLLDPQRPSVLNMNNKDDRPASDGGRPELSRPEPGRPEAVRPDVTRPDRERSMEMAEKALQELRTNSYLHTHPEHFMRNNGHHKPPIGFPITPHHASAFSSHIPSPMGYPPSSRSPPTSLSSSRPSQQHLPPSSSSHHPGIEHGRHPPPGHHPLHGSREEMMAAGRHHHLNGHHGDSRLSVHEHERALEQERRRLHQEGRPPITDHRGAPSEHHHLPPEHHRGHPNEHLHREHAAKLDSAAAQHRADNALLRTASDHARATEHARVMSHLQMDKRLSREQLEHLSSMHGGRNPPSQPPPQFRRSPPPPSHHHQMPKMHPGFHHDMLPREPHPHELLPRDHPLHMSRSHQVLHSRSAPTSGTSSDSLPPGGGAPKSHKSFSVENLASSDSPENRKERSPTLARTPTASTASSSAPGPVASSASMVVAREMAEMHERNKHLNKLDHVSAMEHEREMMQLAGLRKFPPPPPHSRHPGHPGQPPPGHPAAGHPSVGHPPHEMLAGGREHLPPGSREQLLAGSREAEWHAARSQHEMPRGRTYHESKMLFDLLEEKDPHHPSRAGGNPAAQNILRGNPPPPEARQHPSHPSHHPSPHHPPQHPSQHPTQQPHLGSPHPHRSSPHPHGGSPIDHGRVIQHQPHPQHRPHHQPPPQQRQ